MDKNHPAYQEFIHTLRYELSRMQRPAHQVIMDDEDVMRTLKISKRKLQYLKADGVLVPRKIESDSPRTYYLLSDLLDILNKNRADGINPKF
ncbi:MAG: hypothetical protein ACHQFX_12585 [Chitinophagales bacterium]